MAKRSQETVPLSKTIRVMAFTFFKEHSRVSVYPLPDSCHIRALVASERLHQTESLTNKQQMLA